MRNHRAAARYAKSLIELADEMNVLNQVKEDMQLLLKVCKENRLFSVMLKNPVIPHYQKRGVLDKLFSSKMNKLTISAFDLITKKNRENILDTIASEYLDQYNKLKGIQTAVVTTTYGIDAKEQAAFSKTVEEISKKTAELELKVDKALVGGFVLNIGDKQLDESIKTKLNKIQKALTA